jgi:hypothetical protein
MLNRVVLLCLAPFLVAAPAALAADSVEKIRNDKVVVTELSLAPGDGVSIPGKHDGMVVFLDAGSAAFIGELRPPRAQSVERGQILALSGPWEAIRNTGSSTLNAVRVEFLTPGLEQTWGMAGLAPNYTMIVENQYARAYNIKIPAQTFEPQHTHHDRVVICLSGAELEHILPDGSKQPSTLKTGEIAWRLGATHIGHNMGHTDLWVIAIEPK